MVPSGWWARLGGVGEETLDWWRGTERSPLWDAGLSMGVEQRLGCIHVGNRGRPIQWGKLLQIATNEPRGWRKENGGEYKEGMNSRSKGQELVVHLMWEVWWIQVAAHWVSGALWVIKYKGPIGDWYMGLQMRSEVQQRGMGDSWRYECVGVCKAVWIEWGTDENSPRNEHHWRDRGWIIRF